jgi:hypothetical protein
MQALREGGRMSVEPRRFTFLEDRDGSLLRQDQSLVSDVFWPKGAIWHRYLMNPFEASVTAIAPEDALEIARREAARVGTATPERADLYADVTA